ncbi:acyl-ACP--UDP-N-acetylglucosamine O-acyltransferase [Pantanalinema sp. GBBB05]|uniref:acyl-ACP--UDP-N-acetylglucosamine O-acyltransferase n=1 Tax=Pantanalinema sp. GBBB05 TaxID=2604139 RepID=UPI003D817BD2
MTKDRIFVDIHPTAVVDPRAELGSGVKIGAFSYIDRDVKIGDNTTIDHHVTILPYTTVGTDCHIHSGAVLGDLPQDLAFQDAVSYVQIGRQCVIREGVTIHRGTKANSVTELGDGCLLMAFSHVAHNARLGNQVILSNGALVAGYAEVGDRAFISGNCLIHQFTRVGRLVMMTGGSAIQKDVPPFCMTRSVSPNTIMGLNVVGLRRAGFSADDRRQLKQAFRVLYQSGLNVSQAVDRLEHDFDSAAVRELCDFIKSSKRGICKFFKRGTREDDDE